MRIQFIDKPIFTPSCQHTNNVRVSNLLLAVISEAMKFNSANYSTNSASTARVRVVGGWVVIGSLHQKSTVNGSQPVRNSVDEE